MTLAIFARQSKPGQATQGYSGEKLVNYFLRPGDGVSQGVLVGRSGTTPYVTLGPAPVRAMVDNGGTLFAVCDGGFFRIIDGVAEELGRVVRDTETYIAASGRQVAVVAGGIYSVWDGTTFDTYDTGAIETPRYVTYYDGYFIVGGGSSGRDDAFVWSTIDDAKTFNGLDLAFAENSPDGLTGVVADHGRLWLFGQKTVEIWYNDGVAPFVPDRGALTQHGCITGLTVGALDNTLFWVGDDGLVYRSGGGTAEVVSTLEVAEYLATATVTLGFTFTDRGHQFYAIRTDRETLCYDVATRLWHERSTGVLGEPWYCQNSLFVGGVQYLGTETGKIVKLDADVYTDDGETIEAEAVSIPAERGGRDFRVKRMHINVDTGRVSLDRQPQVMMQTSKDGRNWSVEKWRPLGNIGSYYSQAQWHALGFFKRFQVRLRITDPVNRDVYGVHYE